VNEGNDSNFIARRTVDEAIAVDEDLTNRRLGPLRHNPTAIGEGLEGARGREGLLHHSPCTLGGVTRNELSDLVEMTPS